MSALHRQRGCPDWAASWLHCEVKEVISECEYTHCVIYNKMLDTENVPEPNTIFQDVIKMISL